MAEVIKMDALRDTLNGAVKRVREKLEALKGKEQGDIDIAAMFDLQFEANVMNQLTDAASNVSSSVHSANMGVARGIKT